MIYQQEYFEANNILTEEEIQKIIDLGESLNPKEGEIYKQGKTKARNSHISFISNNLENRWIYDKFIAAIKLTNKAANWNMHHSEIEKLQFTKYGPGQHYDWHTDQHVEPYPNGLTRKMSFSCLLNDDYEGGNFLIETRVKPVVPYEKRIHTILPKKNLTIFFPSFMFHKVEPVTKGIRYSLVGWICGTPFK